MKTELLIRLREDADADALVVLLGETHGADRYPMRETNVRRGWLYDEGFERSWVAVAGGAVVGHIALKRGFEAPEVSRVLGRSESDILGITRLFVGSAARGLGAASALMDVADDYSASIGLPMALDVVDGSTAAIALYERRGWTRVATEPAVWSAPDGTHPVLHFYVAPTSVDNSRG